MISKNENILISKLLDRDVIYLNENNTIYDAIKLLAKNNIGASPVVKNKINHYAALFLKEILFVN